VVPRVTRHHTPNARSSSAAPWTYLIVAELIGVADPAITVLQFTQQAKYEPTKGVRLDSCIMACVGF